MDRYRYIFPQYINTREFRRLSSYRKRAETHTEKETPISIKLAQMMRYTVTLCLLLCPLVYGADGAPEDSDEVIRERFEALDCTNTTCYNIKTEGDDLVSWYQYSQSSCKRNGMTPAKPPDEETAMFLMDLANRTITNNSYVWLGLSQEETVNSSAFSNLWRESQPQTVEHGKVRMNGEDGYKWEIADPSSKGWTLCEIPKGIMFKIS
ncbi:uncharacterized protein LOC106468274 [Limulus polyphemus]|uniref:Uncharacterized protein LOC106468274 n=1 Tax=Limulus polyphemus TaxID=6850 RepID=A0ABM1BL33_LIMPO|nr:uncharacterized protein LOC106468274 [Limulus polyphemus]